MFQIFQYPNSAGVKEGESDDLKSARGAISNLLVFIDDPIQKIRIISQGSGYSHHIGSGLEKLLCIFGRPDVATYHEKRAYILNISDELEIGSRENVEVHLKNDLGVEVAVGISDNAGDVVNVSHPTNLKMTPGSRRTIFLTMDPISEGNFNVAVHVSWTTPKKQGGEVGGQVIGGIDILLKGRATAPAQPPALPLIALLMIRVTVTTIVIIVVWLGRKTR